jgi:hypothetical protein
MSGSVDPARLRSRKSAIRGSSALERALAAPAQMVAAAGRLLVAAFSPHRWAERISDGAGAAGRAVVTWLPERVRARIVRATPEYHSIEHAFHVADERARALAPLRDLSALETTLRRHRPDNLHVNGCGDFQLMAREHWHELRGYPELEGFSRHVDSLLSFTAGAAGIKEEVLAMPIYYVQPPVRFHSPEDEDATMRRRMAERVVPRLDAGTVSIWASQMQWLQRPMMFNSNNWGMGSVELQEHTIEPAFGSAS